MYLPKSRYKKEYTPGGEIYESNGSSYRGPYIRTSKGQLFKGDKLKKRMEELFTQNPIIQDITTPVQQLFINYYPNLTPTDYERGYLIRYIVKELSTNRVLEVTKENYQRVRNQETYLTTSIEWELNGKRLVQYPETRRREEGIKVNQETLNRLEKDYKGISSFIFPSQFVQ